MPSIVSTPPRVRIRSKTMTSASSQQQSSRPSALKKPTRGRSTERGGIRKSLSTELAEAASQKREQQKHVSRSRSKHQKEEKKKDENSASERKLSKKEKKEKRRQEQIEKDKQDEKQKAKEKKGRDEKEKEKEKKGREEKEKEKDKKGRDEKEKEKEKEKQDEKEKGKEKKGRDEKEKEKDKKGRDEKEKETEKKGRGEKEKNKDKEGGDEKEKNKEKEQEGKKKKKEPAVAFEPAKKSKIEHIFEAPPQTSAPSTPLTSKQKAEAQFAKLAEHLEDSDSDSVPVTDLEAFVEDYAVQDSDGSSEEGSESEDEEKKEEPKKDEEKKDPKKDEEKKDPKKDEERKGEASLSSEEEEEESEDGAEEGEEEEEEGSIDEDDESSQGEIPEEDKGKTGGAAADSHALVPVTDATTTKTLALRNSVTHKKEWDAFVRQAKTRMPIGLNDMYTSSKQELFSLWLDQGKDWSACSLEVERRQEQQNVAKRGWQAVQGKVLKTRYSPEKWDQVLKSRKAAGLYYEDEDFPGDDDESRQNPSISFFSHPKPNFFHPRPNQVKMIFSIQNPIKLK